MLYSPEEIARVCHEANRALCVAFGDPPQKKWEQAEPWQRESAVAGVKSLLAEPDCTPARLHDRWCNDKLNVGWRHGPVGDGDKKEHPCPVAYDQLPPQQQAKDHVFKAIVEALTSVVGSGTSA